MAINKEHPKWGGAREGSGRKKAEAGRRKIFRSSSVSGTPEEIEALHQMARAQGKSFSRFVIDTLLQK